MILMILDGLVAQNSTQYSRSKEHANAMFVHVSPFTSQNKILNKAYNIFNNFSKTLRFVI
jgi:hypothetical protein